MTVVILAVQVVQGPNFLSALSGWCMPSALLADYAWSCGVELVRGLGVALTAYGAASGSSCSPSLVCPEIPLYPPCPACPSCTCNAGGRVLQDGFSGASLLAAGLGGIVIGLIVGLVFRYRSTVAPRPFSGKGQLVDIPP